MADCVVDQGEAAMAIFFFSERTVTGMGDGQRPAKAGRRNGEQTTNSQTAKREGPAPATSQTRQGQRTGGKKEGGPPATRQGPNTPPSHSQNCWLPQNGQPQQGRHHLPSKHPALPGLPHLPQTPDTGPPRPPTTTGQTRPPTPKQTQRPPPRAQNTPPRPTNKAGKPKPPPHPNTAARATSSHHPDTHHPDTQTPPAPPDPRLQRPLQPTH
jgi:hypothetical protein